MSKERVAEHILERVGAIAIKRSGILDRVALIW